MSVVRWIAWSLLAVEGPAAVESQSSPRARRAISAAAGQALQGDIARALTELDSVPASEFGTRDAALRFCIAARFHPGADGSLPTRFGPFANRAVGAYRAYWRAALLNPMGRSLEETRLHRNLARLAGLPIDSKPEDIESLLKDRFAREGFHVLMGRTPPLRELILWGKAVSERRSVLLPEGPHEVTVKVLDDFASLGWSAYATCDRSFTGGWVKPDGIYAVRPGWKSLDDENFRISFLAHETQHFADKERFANLNSWELEYRGKLAELALADATVSRLLSAFEANQGDDPAVPHSYANRRVLFDLRRHLGLGPAAQMGEIAAKTINEAARTLLSKDSQQRSGGA